MTSSTFLSDVHEVIGKLWSEGQSREQARILELARDAAHFVFVTGQRYRFADFRKTLKSDVYPSAGASLSSHRAADTVGSPQDDLASLENRLRETEAFFTRLRDEADAAGEKERIQIILDALHFIESTGQHRAFGEFLEHIEADAPPYVMAAFSTREEAETWLRNHPNPPDSANVLIANEYHDVIHDRETNFRRLPRNRSLNYYLAELKQEKPPVAVASFANHEEAEAWLKAQPKPARWAWVSIAGEFYVAVYHPNINHRVLYPLSMSNGYELPPDESESPQ